MQLNTGYTAHTSSASILAISKVLPMLPCGAILATLCPLSVRDSSETFVRLYDLCASYTEILIIRFYYTCSTSFQLLRYNLERLETRDFRLETRICRLETRDCRLETRILRLETRIFRLETRSFRLETRYSMQSYTHLKVLLVIF